jgi:hypothetical protein
MKSLRVLLVLIEMKGIEARKGLRVLLELIEMKVIEAMKGRKVLLMLIVKQWRVWGFCWCW